MEHVACPFEWRYGSKEMREVFSLGSTVRRYVHVEVALMKGLEAAGLAPPGCARELEECAKRLEATEVYKLEEKVGHDIASLAMILGEGCGECGRYVHLGATSYDVVDTAWALAIRDALRVIKRRMASLIGLLSHLAMRELDTLMVGRTHGQHALPITLGFKLANYAYELSRGLERILDAEGRVVRCKMSGAVGTMAAWGERGLKVEEEACNFLGLMPHPIATQVAPRDGFAELVSSLAILASQLDRLALEVRELSRTEIGELREGLERVGSSTMPHKRNPVTSERISGLARVVRSFALAALENVPLMHERDLTNSSSERVVIPHVFLAVDQMLIDTEKVLQNLVIGRENMRRNLELTKGAIMSESVLVRLVKKGMARHKAHELLTKLFAEGEQRGEGFAAALRRDPVVRSLLSEEEIDEALDYGAYLGSYKELVTRALEYAESVRGKALQS